MKELYAEHPAMFRNNPLGFLLALLLIPVFGLGLIILLYWYLKTKAEKLVITETDILLEKGLLSKQHSEVNIDTIRTVRVSQSFFDRMFGVGKLELYTAGDNPEITIGGIPDPGKVRQLINDCQNNGAARPQA